MSVMIVFHVTKVSYVVHLNSDEDVHSMFCSEVPQKLRTCSPFQGYTSIQNYFGDYSEQLGRYRPFQYLDREFIFFYKMLGHETLSEIQRPCIVIYTSL